MEILRLTAGEAYALEGPVLIREVVTAPTEIADLDRCHEYVCRALERSPVAGLWVIAHHGAKPPNGEARRHAGRAFGRHGERLVILYSLLGLGFWATFATAASRSLAKLTSTSALFEKSIEGGAQRLALELVGLDPAALVEAHVQLMARLAAERGEGS